MLIYWCGHTATVRRQNSHWLTTHLFSKGSISPTSAMPVSMESCCCCCCFVSHHGGKAENSSPEAMPNPLSSSTWSTTAEVEGKLICRPDSELAFDFKRSPCSQDMITCNTFIIKVLVPDEPSFMGDPEESLDTAFKHSQPKQKFSLSEIFCNRNFYPYTKTYILRCLSYKAVSAFLPKVWMHSISIVLCIKLFPSPEIT